jgi:hypothetical protein
VTLTPAPSSANRFQWQGQQVQFNETNCVGQVAMAVGATAVCYGHTDGTMHCAGRIAQTTFGASFTATTERDVDQIFVSRNVGLANGPAQGLCVHKRNGTATCLGTYNTQGQFGTGTRAPSTTFTQWGTQTNLVALATGTWDQFCALDTTGAVLCAGYSFSVTPSLQPQRSSLGRLYVDEFGQVKVDDPAVFRVSNSRTSCHVTSAGLDCPMAMIPSGTAGQVVDGFEFGPPAPFAGARCWLDSAGRVYCTTGPKFTSGPVLAIAADFDTTTVCAVTSDGALWCLGSNEEGKLGTGSNVAALIETQVQPPGSVRLGCP